MIYLKQQKRVVLTTEEKALLYEYYYNKMLDKKSVQKYGYKLEELFECYKALHKPNNDNVNEHYLCRCPRCNSDNITMYRACPTVKSSATTKCYHAKSKILISHNNCIKIRCKDCDFEKMYSDTYINSMVKYNHSNIVSVDSKYSLEDTQDEYFFKFNSKNINVTGA